jgi:Predicted membrane protein
VKAIKGFKRLHKKSISMRIPPDLKQVLLSVASISVFAILLILGKTFLIWIYIGLTFAVIFGYSIYRTSKTIPVFKENGKEAAQIKKDYKDKVLFRQTAKDTQPFMADYEMERLQLSKKMLILMMVPFVVLIALYIALPAVLRFAFHIVLSRLQITELYVASALASVGASLLVRRRLGLSAASLSSGTQIVYAPRAYYITPKGVIFDPPMRVPNVEVSVLKFPARVKRVERERKFIELESLADDVPAQIKLVRLYTKDVDRLLSVLKSHAEVEEQLATA